MQTTIRKTEKPKTNDKTSKDEVPTKKSQDEKLKRSGYSVSTPRNYVQKSSTADIYVQKKTVTQTTKAPKKVIGTTNKSNASPMKDLLKSSSSTSVSYKKVKSTPEQLKKTSSATPRTGKDLPYLNVTVNSPIAKKKEIKDGIDARKKQKSSNVEGSKSVIKDGARNKDGEKSSKVDDSMNIKDGEHKKDGGISSTVENLTSKVVTNDDGAGDRQRTKTRTLNENEVKVFTPEMVDNNAEMMILSRKLAAKPKAFYVDLDESNKEKPQKAEKSSEEEMDYEDDFESYESDFESYHDSPHSDTTEHDTDDHSQDDDDDNDEIVVNEGDEVEVKERDEEKMLDSGNFELRDTRSANKAKPVVMADILEDTELDVRSSLTDEGFQEMSSAGCSIRTVHTEVLERPLFIDFTKAKENKRRRIIFERLKQRAKDILSMVTLHEMSYSLFEMKPIPYDLYMATFGRSNYIQTASQTFDDGVTEEVQTEEMLCEEKWTQHPVEFSKHNIYLKENKNNRKYSLNTEDYVSKFTFLINKNSDIDINNKINTDENYKSNPLRVYFEQKDGAGPAEMLPYENYKNKLKSNEFNSGRLKKFLKKFESRISSILSANTSSDRNDLTKSKHQFSNGYLTISTRNIQNEKLQFLNEMKVGGVIFSETKSNLLLTVHDKCEVLNGKCIICLWDTSVVRNDPLKILIAIDTVAIGRYKGSADGLFVAALNDGSLHLWDLSEEPTWRSDVASEGKTTNLVEVDVKALTQHEIDREWNLQNRHVGLELVGPQCILQACSFTSSASYVLRGSPADHVVGLQLDLRPLGQDAGRKLLGQVCSLQRIGLITIWSIIQERTTDMGKAYWSKTKLEVTQTISLIDHLDLPRSNSTEDVSQPFFNLNAAKRRASIRRKEKSSKKLTSRQKSAVKRDSDRISVASFQNEFLPNWESGVVCNDLKVMSVGGADNYLVGKNCGEVLCCTRNAGLFKIKRFCVSTDSSSVTSIEASPHSLPYFLAATDSGTVNLCSLVEARVLLTLDCRNGPSSSDSEKYQVDHKGRYLGSSRAHSDEALRPNTGIAVKCVSWSPVNPCCMFALLGDGALLAWDLTHSDIRARHAAERAAANCSATGAALALLTPEGEVQIHKLWSDQHTHQYLELFQKYVALL